jgi:5-methylthioadenosine/S-adenosylhomocysteine deaminase
MKSISCLFTNAVILTMDESMNLYEPGALAIENNLIIDVGLNDEIVQKYTSPQVIDCMGKVLMPGLINAHTHAPMTLLRGLADDLRLEVWLMGYMMPVEREFVSPEFVRLGTSLACAEMIRSGVTCFADMYYFEEAVAQATADAGLRAVCSQTVLKFPTPDAASFEEALQSARDFIKKWKGHPLIVPSIAPHAPYTCTPEILKSATELAIEFDIPLHIHISETALEVENMRRDYGMPVVPYVKKQGLLAAKVIAAHCVHIDEGEMRTLLHAGAGIAHNPSSNMKLASGIAQTKKMLEIGVNLGIGTDGPASNNDLDMFEEIRLAAFLSKVSTGDPTALPAATVLLMATRLGAQALHIGEITGSIEINKRADLIIIDISPLHNSPRFRRNPAGAYAQVIYASKASDVTDVMVEGKWLMQNQKLLTLNSADLIKASQEYAKKIDIFLTQREKSVLSKLIAIGGATEEESFEVQAKVPILDVKKVIDTIEKSGIEIIRFRHYREYDTYLSFDDPTQGYIRFREDHFIAPDETITNVRSRLTHIGQLCERHFPKQVILSRSRFLAPATQSLRFYREYFNPASEVEVEKDRLRYLVTFHNTEFFINVDTILKPALGFFLEVKTRTWSQKDADLKSKLAVELIKVLGAAPENITKRDYIEML